MDVGKALGPKDKVEPLVDGVGGLGKAKDVRVGNLTEKLVSFVKMLRGVFVAQHVLVDCFDVDFNEGPRHCRGFGAVSPSLGSYDGPGDVCRLLATSAKGAAMALELVREAGFSGRGPVQVAAPKLTKT